jgi:hypothetical protein
LKRAAAETAVDVDGEPDNFRMNTGYGRYSAAYSMVALSLL